MPMSRLRSQLLTITPINSIQKSRNASETSQYDLQQLDPLLNNVVHREMLRGSSFLHDDHLVKCYPVPSERAPIRQSTWR